MLKSTNDTFVTLVKLDIVLRFIFGPLIFLSPVLVTIINLLLDGFDGEAFKRSGYARPQYSVYDKVLDYWWYIWVLIYVLVMNVPAKELFILLFVYRTIGQILFLIFKKGFILFLFPNIFELIFFYYLAVHLFHGEATFMTGTPFFLAVGVLSVIGFFRETIIHLKQMNFSGVYLGKTSYWPKRSTTSYKALIFFSFLLAGFVTLNQVLTSKQHETYTARASRANRDGSIISYDATGTLIGNSSDSALYSMELVRVDNQTTYCRTTDIRLLKLPAKQNGVSFIWSDTCLKTLPRGSYQLFYKPASNVAEKRIDFDIVDGKLQR